MNFVASRTWTGWPGDLAPVRFKKAVELTMKQFPSVQRVIVSLNGDEKFADESGPDEELLRSEYERRTVCRGVMQTEGNYYIWIEAEQWPPGEWEPMDCNSDVIVSFEKGAEWVATFFTYENVLTLARKNQSTGECFERKVFLGHRHDPG